MNTPDVWYQSPVLERLQHLIREHIWCVSFTSPKICYLFNHPTIFSSALTPTIKNDQSQIFNCTLSSVSIRHIWGRIIGATWGICASVTSLENSVSTRIAPWTKWLLSDNRACISISNSSGHVSGQSQWAIAEMAYA